MADLRGTSKPLLIKRQERDLAELQYNLARTKVKLEEMTEGLKRAEMDVVKLEEAIQNKHKDIENLKKQFSEDLTNG